MRLARVNSAKIHLILSVSCYETVFYTVQCLTSTGCELDCKLIHSFNANDFSYGLFICSCARLFDH